MGSPSFSASNIVVRPSLRVIACRHASTCREFGCSPSRRSFMESNNSTTTSESKVRRDFLGGKRADGHQRDRRIERGDPRSIRAGTPDPSLTGVAGLVPFGRFLQQEGVDDELKEMFFELKAGPLVVYPMEAQLRLLIDAYAVGEQRVFGLEALAHDPLFVHLAGGVVPSLDTVYRDLCRFDDAAVGRLEQFMSSQGLAGIAKLEVGRVHVDIDTTVEPLFGNQEGALPGPNPRYHGRPSYHPILGVVAETGRCIGARLRPGDTGLGNDDASIIGTYAQRVVAALSRGNVVVVRADAAADCGEILAAIDNAKALFVVKADISPDLCGRVMHTRDWRTTDWDADGRPSVQVAEIDFQRKKWGELGKQFRVIAVRRRDRDSGKQVFLWSNLDFSVHVFITNDTFSPAEDLVAEYDGRAEIEPRIGEFKYGVGIGKVPSRDFHANHVAFLLKLLTHNLIKRYVQSKFTQLATWRLPWVIRVLFRVPGRLVHSARRRHLRLPPASPLRASLE